LFESLGLCPSAHNRCSRFLQRLQPQIVHASLLNPCVVSFRGYFSATNDWPTYTILSSTVNTQPAHVGLHTSPYPSHKFLKFWSARLGSSQRSSRRRIFSRALPKSRVLPDGGGPDGLCLHQYTDKEARRPQKQRHPTENH